MGRRRERLRNERQDMSLLERIAQPVNKLPLMNLLDEEAVQLIHERSMEVLTQIGIAFYDDEAVSILKANGVRVDEDSIAYFDEDTLMHFVKMAPSRFTQLARNPNNNVEVGGNYAVFAPVYGPPFVWDMERGRHAAKLNDFNNFVKLAYINPYINHSGGTVVEPMDEPVPTRHLDMLYSHIKYSDKPFMGSVTSAQNAADSVAMVEMIFGAEAIRQHTALISLINISSPRRLDDRMLGALTVYSRARQASLISPFILSGAMAPTSPVGTLIQANAEVLAGIAYTQMIEPGCPVIYGTFQAGTDMQSGAPVLGAPESQTTLFLSAQMARHYNLPFRSGGGLASSKIPDAQAAYEAMMMIQATVMGHTNFVLHAAGWLEGGLSASLEKFVLDCEAVGMGIKLMQGVDLSEEAQAMDSIRTVPPGGHHLGTDHTIRNMKTAFYKARLFDYDSAEKWEAEGAKDSVQRANTQAKTLLEHYEAPALDEGLNDNLVDFIARRKQEIKSE